MTPVSEVTDKTLGGQHVKKPCLRINRVDQPQARNTVELRPLARYPLI